MIAHAPRMSHAAFAARSHAGSLDCAGKISVSAARNSARFSFRSNGGSLRELELARSEQTLNIVSSLRLPSKSSIKRATSPNARATTQRQVSEPPTSGSASASPTTAS